MDAGDDRRVRTGTFWSGLAHAFTAIVGSGILALPWSVAQLGWILGPVTLLIFAVVTYCAANLLTECYRVGDPLHGRRNCTYIDAVRSFLGAKSVLICAVLQYSILWGTMVGYTIATAMSIATVVRSIGIHQQKHCSISGNLYMLLYGALQIILSQFPNLEKVTVLSVMASVTSVGYSIITLGLTIGKFASNGQAKGSLKVGMAPSHDLHSPTRVWNVFQALGNIAFAFTYSMLLLEIEDTLKSPPAEKKTMRRVTAWAVGGTTVFYVSLGCIGYAAFGMDVPGNILTSDYNPFCVVAIANIAVIIHLATAYQVFCQPLYAAYEKYLSKRLAFLQAKTNSPTTLKLTLFRLLTRTLFVGFTTAVAMALPFFNAILGLLGALSFWPLTIFFPVNMYMVQTGIRRLSPKWWVLAGLSGCCLVVTLVAAAGSTADIVVQLRHAKLFHGHL